MSFSRSIHHLLAGCVIAGVATLTILSVRHDGRPYGQEPVRTTAARAGVHLTKLPLRFEENRGQHDDRVRFVARHPSATLFATDAGLTLAMRSGPVLDMTVPGARPAVPVGRDELVTRTHDLRGNDPARWRTDIRNYGIVAYEGALDGIDLVVHGEDGQLEYDFVVAPGADPRAAMLDIRGADGLSVTEQGDLAIHTERGDVIQRRPRVLQRGADGSTTDVPAAYRVVGPRRVGFEIAAAYDPSRELVIDPVLAYSTYLGGTAGDLVTAIAVDATGAAYVAGQTRSADFPTTANAYDRIQNGASDTFIAKLTPAGDALVFATYIGGSQEDTPSAIAVTADGSALATGYTYSSDFPVMGAIQSTLAGSSDAFVLKLAPSGGALTYSTYLGGAQGDYGASIAVDGSGSAYITGTTDSGAFPIVGAVQTTLASPSDLYVAKLNPAGSALVYSTYLGGTDYDGAGGIAVDGSGSAYVTGMTRSPDFPSASNTYSGGSGDVVVTKLSPSGNAIVYSRYVGGSNLESAAGVAVDAAGNAYVGGVTYSKDFPIAPAPGALQATHRGERDAFVAKLAPAGDALVYSTFLGGSEDEELSGIAVDGRGNAHVVLTSHSSDIPVRNAVQTQYKGAGDVYVARIAASGTKLLSATYLGSTNQDYGDAVAVDSQGDTYVGGRTIGADFPVVQQLQDANSASLYFTGFVAKIATPPIAIAPTSASVAPGDTLTFTASGGSGPGYRFTLKKSASGGNIDPSSGRYVAGPSAGADEVMAVDEAGYEASAIVTVGVDAESPTLPDAGLPATNDAAAGAGAPSEAPADAGCACHAGAPSRGSSVLAAALVALAASLARLRRRPSHWLGRSARARDGVR